jgi:hypothetical protein
MRFSDFSLLQVLVLTVVILSGAIELGRWFGVRAKPQGIGSVPTLEASIHALLAQILSAQLRCARASCQRRTPKNVRSCCVTMCKFDLLFLRRFHRRSN